MKTLKDLLKDTPVTALHGDGSTTVAALAYDSRAVTQGDCFFATRGTQSDGHDFIPDAVAKGASAVVCEQLPAETAHGVAYVVVPDAAGALADMAAAFYGHPSRELKLVGITGTNGKTTTATLLYDLVRALGYKAGLVSTVVYKVGERIVEATHTTPDPVRLNAMMREMADEGCEYCFMECSSHAIVQQRTRGLHFAGGIFSNITHDHLDYHKTFAEYIRAKKLFFDSLAKDAFGEGLVVVEVVVGDVREDAACEMQPPRALLHDGRFPLQDRRDARRRHAAAHRRAGSMGWARRTLQRL